MGTETRTGVWVEDGKVYRREEKQHSPQVYIPLRPDLLDQVVEKARILHNGASMDSWTVSVEAAQDQTLEELKSLIEPAK